MNLNDLHYPVALVGDDAVAQVLDSAIALMSEVEPYDVAKVVVFDRSGSAYALKLRPGTPGTVPLEKLATALLGSFPVYDGVRLEDHPPAEFASAARIALREHLRD